MIYINTLSAKWLNSTLLPAGPHDDHISNSTEFFWLEHAAKYQSTERLKLGEHWVQAAMLLEPNTIKERKAEFAILKREAWFRLLNGQRIKVFSKPRALQDLLTKLLGERGLSPAARDHLFVDAGTVVDGFSLASDGVEFFCHSPFRKHCDNGGYEVRNEASLIFNIRCQIGTTIHDFLQVGDTEWHVLDDRIPPL